MKNLPNIPRKAAKLKLLLIYFYDIIESRSAVIKKTHTANYLTRIPPIPKIFNTGCAFGGMI
jgi:hypothetical protein